MVGAQHAGAVGGDPGEVAPGLVPVAQFLGDRTEFEREPEHQRVRVAPPLLAVGERLFQHPAGRRRVVGRAVPLGQQVRGGQHVRMILAKADRTLSCLNRLREQLPGARVVTRVVQGLGAVLCGGERSGLRHARHAALSVGCRASRADRFTIPFHPFSG